MFEGYDSTSRGPLGVLAGARARVLTIPCRAHDRPTALTAVSSGGVVGVAVDFVARAEVVGEGVATDR